MIAKYKLNLTIAVTIACLSVVLERGNAQETNYRLAPPLRLAERRTAPFPNNGIRANPFSPESPSVRTSALAASGYCVVTLRQRQDWQPGANNIQANFDGKAYRFVGLRERDIFTARPEFYVPVLNGDCLVTYVDTENRIAGKLRFGIIHKQRLYFFSSKETLSRFEQNPSKYDKGDLFDDGRCVVSRVDEQRVVAGLPETTAIVDGKRYFFASAYHRRKFISQPWRYISMPESISGSVASVEIPSTDIFDSPLSDFVSIHNTPKLKNRNRGVDSDNDDIQVIGKLENRGLSGYCPVTIRTHSIWRRGKSKFKSTFDGKTYFMNGPEELAAFQNDPLRYLPVLGGDSVVVYAEDYQRVAGSVYYANIFSDRLYLFTTSEEREVFRKDPESFKNADLACEGYCVVTRMTDKQEAEGSTEFETVYDGMRYRFQSEERMKKFLEEPAAFVNEKF